MNEVDIIEKVIRNIAHEVRNPLTTIKGYAQLLSQKKDPTLVKKSHDMIIEQSERIDLLFAELYNSFTVTDDEMVQCDINEILYSVIADSHYREYIVHEATTQCNCEVYAERLRICVETIINGFNWKYFNGVSLHLDVVCEKLCRVNFLFKGIVFDDIPEELFYYPFQCKQYFVKGTELFKVYCIAKRSEWEFEFASNHTEFAIGIPLKVK